MKYETDPRLTCDHGWESSMPGYTYWRGVRFEHLGHSGIGNWIEKYPTWIDDTVYRMEILEGLGVPPTIGYFHWDWFKHARKKADISYFDYFAYYRDFYIRDEGDDVHAWIAFPTNFVDLAKNPWKIGFDILVWSKQNKTWYIKPMIANCPDVIYHAMIKAGWESGSKFAGSNAPNIIGKSYGELCACFGWFGLPENAPFAPKKDRNAEV